MKATMMSDEAKRGHNNSNNNISRISITNCSGQHDSLTHKFHQPGCQCHPSSSDKFFCHALMDGLLGILLQSASKHGNGAAPIEAHKGILTAALMGWKHDDQTLNDSSRSVGHQNKKTWWLTTHLVCHDWLQYWWQRWCCHNNGLVHRRRFLADDWSRESIQINAQWANQKGWVASIIRLTNMSIAICMLFQFSSTAAERHHKHHCSVQFRMRNAWLAVPLRHCQECHKTFFIS